MYKFIKYLPHENTFCSHCAYLYQDITTKKYYLSFTHPDSENIIDKSNQYMLFNNKPIVIKPEFLKNITKDIEVMSHHFIYKKVNNYLL